MEKTRQTDTYIFFNGGILSNWYQGDRFYGERALQLLTEALTVLNIPHPDENAFATLLIRTTYFRCTEQWMMAIKGWLFERDIPLSDMTIATSINKGVDFAYVQQQMLAATPPPTTNSDETTLYNNCICKCLRSKNPREQKAFGRQCRNFNPETWTLISGFVVTCSLIARAENNSAIDRIYKRAQKERLLFAEASADKIWGIGLWPVNNTLMDDSRNWTGQNRLGKCHDMAARLVTQSMYKDRPTEPSDLKEEALQEQLSKRIQELRG